MRIRCAIPGDELVLRRLRLEALSDAPSAFGSTYERELARTDEDWRRWLSTGVTFFVEDQEGARGLVAARVDAAAIDVVQLLSMWLHPDLRGSRAGDGLVTSVVSWAKDHNASMVRLDVVQANLRARRFYERNGFSPTGQTRLRERDGEIEVQMERLLATARPDESTP